MTLSTLAILLGTGLSLLQVYGLIKPEAFGAAVRRFPRSLSSGYVLMMLATVWFVWNLQQEANEDFAAYKKLLVVGFGCAGVAVCVFVRDFLAVRGLAVNFLLLAKVMLDTQRGADTDWRWVIAAWAYVLVVAGIWFTISPWRLRDLLHLGTATERRTRAGCALRLAFGLFVIILGLTAY